MISTETYTYKGPDLQAKSVWWVVRRAVGTVTGYIEALNPVCVTQDWSKAYRFQSLKNAQSYGRRTLKRDTYDIYLCNDVQGMAERCDDGRR